MVRWLGVLNLETLEKLVLRSRRLQQFALGTHRRALRAILPELPPVRRAVIIGGGLFPRTAMLLRELMPEVEIVIIDRNRRNLKTARTFVDVECRNANWAPGEPCEGDLLVIPLCFDGDRRAIYEHPPAPAVLVHDWIWRRRGHGRIVSRALLKRLNLIMP